MRPVALIVLLALPLAEIATFVAVGAQIGVAMVILLTVATTVIGSVVLRRQGLRLLAGARASLDHGETPAASALDGIFTAVAGVLLILPGFLTDLAGGLLLVAPLRRELAKRLWQWLGAHVTVTTWRRYGSTAGAGPVLDLEATDIRDVTPETDPQHGRLTS